MTTSQSLEAVKPLHELNKDVMMKLGIARWMMETVRLDVKYAGSISHRDESGKLVDMLIQYMYSTKDLKLKISRDESIGEEMEFYCDARMGARPH